MTLDELKHVYTTMSASGVDLCSVKDLVKQLESITISDIPELESVNSKKCATCFHCVNLETGEDDGCCAFCKEKSHYKYSIKFLHNTKPTEKQPKNN